MISSVVSAHSTQVPWGWQQEAHIWAHEGVSFHKKVLRKEKVEVRGIEMMAYKQDKEGDEKWRRQNKKEVLM